ncbi:hypothetical protein GH714_012660 [Hevea brasiliensis]|uniref:Anthocyanin acyltransferase n=1 Tax=Hevea brasiliensis TaxID=3981 RepID=A0A6A6MIR5_HEVBR|nr:hypothetical protein GH714_012660 [Hevea brasiliensis]
MAEAVKLWLRLKNETWVLDQNCCSLFSPFDCFGGAAIGLGIPLGSTLTLKLLPSYGSPANPVRGTYELSREDLQKLRQKVLFQLEIEVPKENPDQTNPMHLSTFVLTFAYTVVSIVKARGLERNRKVMIGFTADCRARLEPPLPANYFGNCVGAYTDVTEAEVLMEENGLAFVAQSFSKLIKGLGKGPYKGAKDSLERFLEMDPGTMEIFGVAGSPRFQVYESDFGWGRPKKVEITSIDRTNGSISMAESKDGSGGVEIGIVLKKNEMEIFDSLFINGLKDL